MIKDFEEKIENTFSSVEYGKCFEIINFNCGSHIVISEDVIIIKSYLDDHSKQIREKDFNGSKFKILSNEEYGKKYSDKEVRYTQELNLVIEMDSNEYYAFKIDLIKESTIEMFQSMFCLYIFNRLKFYKTKSITIY